MAKHPSDIDDLIKLRQWELANQIFKKEEKKDDKKPWYAGINPKEFFKVYLLLILLYPVIGKAYTMLLFYLLK